MAFQHTGCNITGSVNDTGSVFRMWVYMIVNKYYSTLSDLETQRPWALVT